MKLKSLFKRHRQDPALFAGLSDYRRNGTRARQSGAPILVTGVGRSGTHFMAKLFEKNAAMRALHLDDIGDSVGDAYSWFCKWYHPETEMKGLIESRRYLVCEAGKEHKRLLESNPMIALMIEDLVPALGAKAVIMVRHPRQVIESHYQKGWYKDVIDSDISLRPFYSYLHDRPNHFFSRIMPRESKELDVWTEYGRLGRIAWMWRAVNQEILEQIERHRLHDHVQVVYLNNFNYQRFSELCNWLLVPNSLSAAAFERIVKQRPGKGGHAERPVWSDKDRAEFNNEVSRIVDRFAYIDESKSWLFT